MGPTIEWGLSLLSWKQGACQPHACPWTWPAVAGLVFPYMPLYVLRCLYLSWHHQVGVWKTWYKYKQGQIKECHHFVLNLATFKGKYGPIRTNKDMPCHVLLEPYLTFFYSKLLTTQKRAQNGYLLFLFVLNCQLSSYMHLVVIFCFIGAKWSRLDLISPY